MRPGVGRAALVFSDWSRLRSPLSPLGCFSLEANLKEAIGRVGKAKLNLPAPLEGQNDDDFLSPNRMGGLRDFVYRINLA